MQVVRLHRSSVRVPPGRGLPPRAAARAGFPGLLAVGGLPGRRCVPGPGRGPGRGLGDREMTALPAAPAAQFVGRGAAGLGGSSCMVKITPNAPNLDHAKNSFPQALFLLLMFFQAVYLGHFLSFYTMLLEPPKAGTPVCRASWPVGPPCRRLPEPVGLGPRWGRGCGGARYRGPGGGGVGRGSGVCLRGGAVGWRVCWVRCRPVRCAMVRAGLQVGLCCCRLAGCRSWTVRGRDGWC